MHRTTIMLPEELRRRASREAEALGISLGELIRRRLAATLDEDKAELPRFFTRAPWNGPGPSDVALRHDDYLYGP